MDTPALAPAAPTPATSADAAYLRQAAASAEWHGLPIEERNRLRYLLGAFCNVRRPGITAQLARIAGDLHKSPPTVRRWWDQWNEADRDWRVLADGRKFARKQAENPVRSKAFRDYLQKLAEQNQRSTEAAIRQLWRQWDARKPIPGYDGHPGWPKRPSGWSARNLRNLIDDHVGLDAMRFGIKTAKKHLPQCFRTRAGLWVGSHIQCDDVWHDNLVRFGHDVTRVLEFGALDVFSACRYAWGTKPRMPKTDGGKGFVDLTSREFRFFLAGLLWTHGYNRERGTTLILEHAKTTVPDHVIDLLADEAGIRVTKGGLTGAQQAVLGLWGGRAGGESNTKSHLESLHNLIHNELAALPGQTGMDRQHAQESTHGLGTYQQALLDWARTLPAELAAQLRHPLLDYHTQFLPLLDHIYRVGINGRADHRLEGWKKCGHYLTEYTLDPDNAGPLPGDPGWLTIDEIPEATRGLIAAAAREEPRRWSRHRPMTPAEVFAQGRAQLVRPSPALMWDIIGHDQAVERTVRGSYIRFHDQDIDDEELIYEARILQPDGTEAELPAGETFAVMSFPYFPDILLVGDARGRCKGIAKRVPRTCIADTDAMIDTWARNAQRRAERLAPLRDRWEPEERAAQDLRRHNAALGFPGTPGRARPDSGQREARDHQRREDTTRDRLDHARAVRALQQDPSDPGNTDLLTDDSDCPFD